MKERYTHEQIGEAYKRYFRKIDPVIEVLRMAPQLSQLGVNTVANASIDFMIISHVHQQLVRGIAVTATIEDGPMVCRELILSCNPDMAEDESLLDHFASTPLEVEDKPFIFVAYDNETLKYVLEHARVHMELPKAKIMLTERNVPFYLARDNDINGIFPTRVRLEEGVSLIFRNRLDVESR